ncbi:hypothetical protein DFA_05219 [Cavenderia fasciculata]|uniref:Uncharacterized protein n=1 Tax=Cavenderia fasciculata TaxID=261658 RepID=F4PNN6_CACFS|nr:uncharacterized protein DFA_05219 [Cavenderia fasciculata]EGG23089.1 hypothetical protein DFA_05219 [Cavenderia fasciculata]|eukprot:XP_004360940.1 hypothetical protein DFA_05219 [Cavenderia fasciculata]
MKLLNKRADTYAIASQHVMRSMCIFMSENSIDGIAVGQLYTNYIPTFFEDNTNTSIKSERVVAKIQGRTFWKIIIQVYTQQSDTTETDADSDASQKDIKRFITY